MNITLWILTSALCGFGGLALAQSGGAPEAPSMDLYLLVGQSNMAGRGRVTSEDKKPAPRILVLNKSDEWVSQGEPIHFDKGEAGVGLGFTFAKLRAARQPAVTIGLIPCAVGGTSIEQWQPDGELYKNAIRRAKLGMERGTLKAILWHQGESECGTQEKASAYEQSLAKLIKSFRTDLKLPNVPFVAGELGEFLYTRSKSPFSKTVNEQIRSLPKKVPFTAVATSEGLVDKGDQLHFDSDSQKEFGKRYDEALSQLEKQK